MKPSFIYSFRVWITSVLLGPLVYYPTQLIMEPQYPHRFEYGFTLYAFLFSLPSFALATVIVLIIRGMPINQLFRKLILCVAGIVLTAMPFYLIKGSWVQQGTEYLIAYGSIIVIGIWVYRLDAPNVEDKI